MKYDNAMSARRRADADVARAALAHPALAGTALLVAIGIGIARVVWIIAYHLASKDDPEYSAAVRRLGRPHEA